MSDPSATGAPETGQAAEPERTEAAAGAVRALIGALRVADAPADTLAEVTALAERAADLLEPHAVSGVHTQAALHFELGRQRPGETTRDPAVIFPYSPVVGPLSPLSPPIAFDVADGRVRAVARLDARYAGPPGMVHGGVIALVFDELLGVANVVNDVPAFTGTLSIRYERPTPIEAELELEAWIESTEGRKVRPVGTIRHQGEVTARAEGVFIRAAGWEG